MGGGESDVGYTRKQVQWGRIWINKNFFYGKVLTQNLTLLLCKHLQTCVQLSILKPRPCNFNMIKYYKNELKWLKAATLRHLSTADKYNFGTLTPAAVSQRLIMSSYLSYTTTLLSSMERWPSRPTQTTADPLQLVSLTSHMLGAGA